ncbi:glucosamine-6-phosphate isomerase [Echinicola jeungdonensis]|uniref:Glucosamine-6-phosphate isomerase n=1 Tax=Echinicola jeungdonensis TaxID=709343 RepID=A0ABV5J0R4_9BACT|nr:glucosamine-6-phosphate isomerase [Echinicola jeungdonensis]MDN3667851.1 glucosamine-6-phosphate isomerase [Echinicola jeungdonensis]
MESKVEQSFLKNSGDSPGNTQIPYLLVNNFPKLGLLTACRFLEWVAENPEGVISLPTGKTPEFFIKWTRHLLENWNSPKVKVLLGRYGLEGLKKPDMRGLQFVQIDEFYPIPSRQHNSFFQYVQKYYIQGFGLDYQKAQLINGDEIKLHQGKSFNEVFPEYQIDLSLRHREARNKQEEIEQLSIFLIDQWCSEYEHKIREKGGIGFFLGGIGPDGHIAFNIRGSDAYSTTRLTATNFETQAVAAGDLGGMEVSSNRLVITIGLGSILYNPSTTAIIMAAGEAKAPIVKASLENPVTNIYPATILQNLKNARFYLTQGAASLLEDQVFSFYKNGNWTLEKTEKAVLSLCQEQNKYAKNLEIRDLETGEFTRLIPHLSEDKVETVIKSTIQKLQRGLQQEENEVLLHTGPHHDDISLGLLPHITHQLQQNSNKTHFAILTSGFTAVTNAFVKEILFHIQKLIQENKIQMLQYDDFFSKGFQSKTDKDVYHYLTHVASDNQEEQIRGLCHRMVRALVEIFQVKNKSQLLDSIERMMEILNNSYDGEKNPPTVQQFKGQIREFEEELVWAHFGVKVKNVHHLRLGFYTGDIFTAQPEKKRDVAPIVNLFRKINPTKISLTMDPEGSGPDTHYKVLQAIAEALREWKKEKDLGHLRIIGYRNVWHHFEPSEANVIVPVSLGDLDVMENSFSHCYRSQVNASFPSYAHHGKFSTLAKKIWVNQLKDIQLLLGKDYFYQHESPRVRASHGLIFFKDMDVDEFLIHARKLEESIEGMA